MFYGIEAKSAEIRCISVDNGKLYTIGKLYGNYKGFIIPDVGEIINLWVGQKFSMPNTISFKRKFALDKTLLDMPLSSDRN